ncbi:MAG: SocA family protein [Xanthomonadales bacterium]|nr:SocA family protein [Xanthomonadales bacterium]
MYNEIKAAQAAAHFLILRGGQMSSLKLMKLLYLSDRESMNLYGYPMTGDNFSSLPHGPVLSVTKDFMDGSLQSCEGGWQSLMNDKKDYEIALQMGVQPEHLGSLSQADIEILDSVWDQFGKMNRWEIRDYTHELPEWEDPRGSSMPIRYKDVLLALSKPLEEAKQIEANILEAAELENTLAQL